MIMLIWQALQTNWYDSKYRMYANYSVNRHNAHRNTYTHYTHYMDC